MLAGPDKLEWSREGTTLHAARPARARRLLVAPLLLFVLGRSLADLPWPQRVLSLLLRLGFLALLALGLARLARTAETRKVCTVVLVDVSDSVTAEALEDARAGSSIERSRRAAPRTP